MIPILHEQNYDGSSTTIIGRLSDCIRCEVTEKLNGEYELEMEYLSTGLHAKDLTTGRVILVKVRKSIAYAEQPFRIYEVRQEAKGIMEVYAHHISYDLNMVLIRPFTQSGASTVMTYLTNNIVKRSIDVLPWAFATDVSSSSQIDLKYPVPVRQLLGGMEGSVLDVFGGEYEWDGFTVNLLNHRGQDRGVYIRYGINLVDLEKTEECDGVYSHVTTYYYSEGDNVLVQASSVPAVADFAEHSTDLVQSRTRLVDVTDQFAAAPTVNELNALANTYAGNMSLAPRVGVDVEFIDLSSVGESTGLNSTILLGDTIHVVYAAMGVSVTKKVVETTWDVLADRYSNVVVGSPATTLADTISDMSNEASSGGGGGTSDYNQLINLPTIAGHTVIGALTLADLGIASATTVSNLSDTLSAVQTTANNAVKDVKVAGSSIVNSSKVANIPSATTSQEGTMTTTQVTKLNGIEAGAQVNIIETVKLNGTALPVTNKTVDVVTTNMVSDVKVDNVSILDSNRVANIFTAGMDVTTGSGSATLTAKVQDVWVDGTSVMDGKIAKISTSAFTSLNSVWQLSNITQTGSAITASAGIAGDIFALKDGTIVVGLFPAQATAHPTLSINSGTAVSIAAGNHIWADSTYVALGYHESGNTPLWYVLGEVRDANESHHGLMTASDYTKLTGIESGAEANVIEVVKVNNTALTPDANKAVNISAVTSFNGQSGAVTYTPSADTAYVQYDPDSESTQVFETGGGDSFEVVIVGPSTGEIDYSLLPIDTSLSSSSDNYHVPSSKCVYDLVGDIETLLRAL